MSSTAAPQSTQPMPDELRQHSPLPWSYRPWDYDDWGWIRADDGSLAATARGDGSETHDRHRVAGTDPYGPNAEFIVDCVNSHASLTARNRDLEAALRAGVRAANLAIFVIRKQGVMPNSSWESGFEDDLKTASAALPPSSGMARAPTNSGA